MRQDMKSTLRPQSQDGIVYIGSNDGFLYALDGESGELHLALLYRRPGRVLPDGRKWRGLCRFGRRPSARARRRQRKIDMARLDRCHQQIDSGGRRRGGLCRLFGRPPLRAGCAPAENGCGVTRPWFTTPFFEVDSSPAVAKGVVYFTSANGHLFALEAPTGKFLWERYVGTNSSYHGRNTSPTVADDVVYVGTFSGELSALDAATGDTLWQYDLGSEQTPTPAVVDGVIYTGSRLVYALDVRPPPAR